MADDFIDAQSCNSIRKLGGWESALRGKGDDAVAQIRTGLIAWRAMKKSQLPPCQRFLADLSQQYAAMVKLLGRFVRCESPSHDKAAVDRFGDIVAQAWRTRGASVSKLKQRKFGDHIRAELTNGHRLSAPQILVLGHLDTVYPLGTLQRTPFRIAKAKAWGPGSFDMKGGLVLALFATDALRAARAVPEKRVVFLWTSDEEIGSESSRAIIEAEALRSEAVLVLEPALGPEGKLKTSRKGTGGVEITVTGRSAHAGIEPEKGVNAVHELALQIERLMRMNDMQRGITVQTTVVSGGTVSNVVPDSAQAQVDIRFSRLADAARLEHGLHSLRPILKDAKIAVRGGINRPPLERTRGVQNLFQQAHALMASMGLELAEGSTGGGSDGNLTGALGVPTLDGLGAVGDGAHSPMEHVVISALPERAALLASLLLTI